MAVFSKGYLIQETVNLLRIYTLLNSDSWVSFVPIITLKKSYKIVKFNQFENHVIATIKGDNLLHCKQLFYKYVVQIG